MSTDLLDLLRRQVHVTWMVAEKATDCKRSICRRVRGGVDHQAMVPARSGGRTLFACHSDSLIFSLTLALLEDVQRCLIAPTAREEGPAA